MKHDVSADLVHFKKAIMTLNTEHREILILVCAKGMNYEKVSDVLQIPVGTVRTRLTHARAELQFVMITMAAQAGVPGISTNANMPVVPAYIASGAPQKGA